MSSLPPDAISVHDDQITVDADAVADGLGLSIQELRQEMTDGRVVSVAEAGIAEDDGRLRLTFRHGERIWRIVRLADGRLVEEQAVVSDKGQVTERQEPEDTTKSTS